MAKKPGRKPLAAETTKASFLLPTPLLTGFKAWCAEAGTTISKVMRHWMEQAVSGTPPYSLPDGAPGTGDAPEGGIPDVDADDRKQLKENTKAIEELRDGQKELRDSQFGMARTIGELKNLILSALQGKAPAPADPEDIRVELDEGE